MRILLDECLPRDLKHYLPGHSVYSMSEFGWAAWRPDFNVRTLLESGQARTRKGAQLRIAETSFDVLVTVDRNLEYQQDLRSLALAIVVLAAPDNRFETLRPLMLRAATMLSTLTPGAVPHIAS